MMDEGKRLKDKLQPPDTDLWNEQMQMVRVFDQLIYNVDRNMGNLLIGKTWRVWAIDHTRAFRYSKHAQGARERDALRPAGHRRSQAAQTRGPQEVRLGSSSLTIRSTGYSPEGTRSSRSSKRPGRQACSIDTPIEHRHGLKALPYFC